MDKKEILKINLERKKELLNKLGEKKFQELFSELMAIGVSYKIDPNDIVCILTDEDTYK